MLHISVCCSINIDPIIIIIDGSACRSCRSIVVVVVVVIVVLWIQLFILLIHCHVIVVVL